MSYVDRGRVELKGLNEPVHVMQVRFALDMPAVTEVDRRWWTPLRLAAAVAGIAVLAAVVALAATRAGGHHSPNLGTNVVGILDSSGRIVGQVSLHGRPGGVAAGPGSVWATDTEHDAVVQIDPAGRVVDTIPTGHDPTGVAVGGGGVWVADSGSGTVSWINANTPSDQSPTPIPVGQGPGPIAYGKGAAWVVNTTDGTLQRITPDLKPSAPIAIGGTLAAVTVGGGSVWVTDTSSSSVVKVDPRTRSAVRIAVGNNPVAVAFGAGRVWVANAADGTVMRLDPGTNQKTEITVGRNPNGVAYARDAVWVAVGQPPSVVRINAGSLHLTSTPVASLPQAVATANDHTWVTALAPPASHRGGTLRIETIPCCLPPDPGYGSPGLAHWQLLAMTNDGLVTYRRVGGPAGAQVVPDLAVAMPTVSDEGRTYTFQLRRGIHYSNGRPVRASDFRYAIERQIRHHTTTLYYQSVLFSTLVGYQACVRVPSKCSLAKAIQTEDETGTVTIHLSRPDPALPQKLATTFADFVPPGSPPPDSGKPVPATGPYKIARHSGKHGLLLIRNRYFHEWSADAQPAGYPDQMRWTFVADASKELTDVERGTADVMLDQPPTNRLGELRTRYAALAHPYAKPATNYLALNTRVPPFDKVAARQAVNLAVDRNRVSSLLGGSEFQAPTCQILPPGIPGYAPYCPYTANPTPSGASTAPDVAQAERLVRASGTRGMAVIVWLRPGYPPDAAETRYLTSVLDLLGYHASIHVATNSDDFNNMALDSRNRVQAFTGSWIADYPSPIDFFDILLTCHAFKRASQANLNWSEFCDPHLDRLVHAAEAAQAIDPPRAVALWQDADREAVNEAAWVPLTNEHGLDVISGRVGNYQHHPQWSGALLDQLWVR